MAEDPGPKLDRRRIAARLESLNDSLGPIREAGLRYLSRPSTFSPDGVVQIGHRPWVAELNYLFTLYPGASDKQIKRYERQFGIAVPALYGEFLAEINGAFCFGMSLYGIPQSMLGAGPPLLDRSKLQCHNLASAVKHWSREYGVPGGFFHFGSRIFSEHEIAGYFLDGKSRIVGAVKSRTIGEWSRFSDFLAQELAESEKLEEQLHGSHWDA